MSDQAVSAVKAGYDAFGRGDVPAVLGAMTEDIEWHEAEGMPYGGVYRGREAIVSNVFGPILADVDGFTAAPDELIRAVEVLSEAWPRVRRGAPVTMTEHLDAVV